MVDVVWPVKISPPGEPRFLRYSMRTVWHHLNVERVWIVGHRPNFVDWSEVGHIASKQAEQRFANVREPQLRFLNQRANLEALLASDVAEDFIWMNDDFFALADTDSVPFFHRGNLRRYLHDLPEGGAYREGLTVTLKILESWGYPNPDNYAVHAPVQINKTDLGGVMERAWSEGLEGGFMRSLYPVGRTDHAHVEIVDPKIKTIDGLPELGHAWVSTTPSSWTSGKVGDLIRNRYWRPCPYET